MKIYIRAEIVIELDGMQNEKETGRQTDIRNFVNKRPSKASKPQKVVEQPKAKTGPSKRATRSDLGGWHHCSRCGNAGTKATKSRGGRCKHCQFQEWV